jgi:hypothetical protein
VIAGFQGNLLAQLHFLGSGIPLYPQCGALALAVGEPRLFDDLGDRMA